MTENEPRKIGIFGYEIGNWVSLVALVTAVFSIGWQLRAYYIGADVWLLQPRGVEFACADDSNCRADSNLKLVVDRLQIVNDGASGYDALIDPFYVNISIIDEDENTSISIDLFAQYFSDRTISGIYRESATGIFVKAQSVADREVEYYPRIVVDPSSGEVNRSNFLKFEKFKQLISGDLGKSNVKIAVTLIPRVVNNAKNSPSIICVVPIDNQMRANALDIDVGTFPRDCLKG